MNLDGDTASSAVVIVVDDEPANVALVESILYRSGVRNVRGTTNPAEVEVLFRAARPDAVLLDLHMPQVSGLELLREISSWREPDDCLPVFILSADATMQAKLDALAEGATDFLSKPFDATEVGLRVLHALETRRLHLRLGEEHRTLDLQVRARTEDLERAHLESLRRLLLVNEFRDDETAEHTSRVGIAAAQ